MTTPVSAVIAEGLSKQYSLGESNEAYLAIRDVLARRSASTIRKVSRVFSSEPASPALDGTTRKVVPSGAFLALDDVSFEIKHGDVVGLIGRNGSGKSTLLKIISRITTPTRGRARIRGRLASLLEVGTGFHGELTGRENVLLNGAILGMKHREIKSKFDEIVAFADVEQFLDTPVKRYSSGMFIRLAFSVAAHLDPDILLVDEVLAVGDAAFQKKCLAKLGEAGQEGRTVVFVSHNMNAVEQLCTSGILLDRGKLIQHSPDVADCIRQYASRAGTDFHFHRWEPVVPVRFNDWFNPSRMYLGDRAGNPVPSPLGATDDVWLHVEGTVEGAQSTLRVGYNFFTSDGVLLYSTWHTDGAVAGEVRLGQGQCHLRSRVPTPLLNEGGFRVELVGSVQGVSALFPRESAPSLSLTIGSEKYGTSYWMLKRLGILAPQIEWEVGTA